MGKDRSYSYPELLLDLSGLESLGLTHDHLDVEVAGDGKVDDGVRHADSPDELVLKPTRTRGAKEIRKYRRVAEDLCEFYGVTIQRVLTGTTDHKMTVIKMAMARKFREEFGLSYPVIGALMGRDHSTIAYYLGKKKREWRNGKLRPTMDKLRDRKTD